LRLDPDCTARRQVDDQRIGGNARSLAYAQLGNHAADRRAQWQAPRCLAGTTHGLDVNVADAETTQPFGRADGSVWAQQQFFLRLHQLGRVDFSDHAAGWHRLANRAHLQFFDPAADP